MKTKYLLIALAALITACSSNKNKNPHIEIETRIGDIEVELYPGQAPKTVAAFLSYIEAGYYKMPTFTGC
ncbi:peptidylprolyl isomerase [Paraflavitalea speifideaquila]|uniref:peptidylprolyl isomerase n=1 Tax=Paraflavitalea speifideaquila TaxID=3076558 RepID=UPI00331304AC